MSKMTNAEMHKKLKKELGIKELPPEPEQKPIDEVFRSIEDEEEYYRKRELRRAGQADKTGK